MKKLLILTTALLTGGFALPVSAQSRHCQSQAIEIFISGYLPCGSPIYSKRVRHGQHHHNERLTGHELHRYLDRRRRVQAQRERERRIAQERYYGSRYAYRNHRRCR